MLLRKSWKFNFIPWSYKMNTKHSWDYWIASQTDFVHYNYDYAEVNAFSNGIKENNEEPNDNPFRFFLKQLTHLELLILSQVQSSSRWGWHTYTRPDINCSSVKALMAISVWGPSSIRNWKRQSFPLYNLRGASHNLQNSAVSARSDLFVGNVCWNQFHF